ncbi:MAG: hypothetical protein ACYC7D_05290 [Nitrososphaerales archaeon]
MVRVNREYSRARLLKNMFKVKSRSLKPNPALKRLNVFVGNWDMALSAASFLPDPKTKVHGPASFDWVENGAFLVMYQGEQGDPQATWLIGGDESTDSFKVLYFDSRKVSRIYQMSFKNGVWKMWRDAPGFSQRFKGVLSKNRNTIIAEWEKSSDGRKWEHDFDVKYTRRK